MTATSNISRILLGGAVLLGGILALAKPASAAIITVDATAGLGERFIASTAGSAVPDGNQVQIGFFDSGFDLVANAANTEALRNAWNPFDLASSPTVTTNTIPDPDEPGRFGGSLSADEAGFAGERIHMFAFLTTGNVAPDASWSNVLEHGIFTNLTSADWVFPDGTAATTLVTSNGATTVYYGSINGSGGTGTLQLGLSNIPEPSTAGVCGLLIGTSMLLSRRRSRRPRRILL